jgi:pyruvate,orthophosphate dikinase
MSKKHVYFFGGGKAEGNKEMKKLLGGKGANLAEMSSLGIRVPPGFTITSEVCIYYEHNKQYPEGLEEQIDENLKKLEEVMGQKFGDSEDPLLVSARSGAAISMPGMMDTVLNIGLNDETVKGIIKKFGDERPAYDSYRRLIQMFGNVVLGIDSDKFEEKLDEKKEEKGVEYDIDLDANDLKELVGEFKEIVKEEVGIDFPDEPRKQIQMAIDAVFESWDNPRAITYRRIHNIPNDLGTAVNIQTMVFGNTGEDSGTGVAFTRNPSTGEDHFYGEFLMNAQGEDVVAGIRTPRSIDELDDIQPDVYKDLVEVNQKLEEHYTDMQDWEFTIQDVNSMCSKPELVSELVQQQ